MVSQTNPEAHLNPRPSSLCLLVDAKLSNTRSDQQNKDGYHSFSVLKQFDKSFGEDPESTHLSRKTLMDEFMRTSRACNIDLAPKILFS